MKKVLFTILFSSILLSLCTRAQNYDNAVGLRLGWGLGGSIKHFFDESKAVEGILQLGGPFPKSRHYFKSINRWMKSHPGYSGISEVVDLLVFSVVYFQPIQPGSELPETLVWITLLRIYH